jgi:hypothetical protein
MAQNRTRIGLAKRKPTQSAFYTYPLRLTEEGHGSEFFEHNTFARVRETVMDVIHRTKEGKTLDPERFYISVQAGVDEYLSETEE